MDNQEASSRVSNDNDLIDTDENGYSTRPPPIKADPLAEGVDLRCGHQLIFYSSHLEKILELPGGRIIDPSSGKSGVNKLAFPLTLVGEKWLKMGVWRRNNPN